MNALTIKALALLSRQAVIDVELLATITEILKQRIWRDEASSPMAYFVNVLRMSEDSVVRRWNAADLLERYPHIVKPMLEAREIHLTGLSMLHAVVNDSNAEALFTEARGKSKRAVEAICCRIQPKPALQSYVRRIATNDDRAPVREFTHVARFMLSDATKEQLDEAFNLVSDADLNDIMARALTMFVERTLMVKRRVLKQTNAGRAIRRGSQPSHDDVAASASPSLQEEASPVLTPATRAMPVGNGEANAFEAVEHLDDNALVPDGPRTHTRYVTAKVCRAVFVRDGRQCQFELKSGAKCLSPKNPQLHHKENYAWGGEATEENLTVYCRMHNLYQGELDFGAREAADPHRCA